MFRSLFVPLDGSDVAERALPVATQLAHAASGRVILFRAAFAPLAVEVDYAWHQRLALEAAQRYVETVARVVAARAPVEMGVTYGMAADEIVRESEQRRADCIVMATHGRTGVGHVVFGSVAESVLANSRLPVLLIRVRTGEQPQAPFDAARSRVLVALDGTPLAEAALEAALGLVGAASELTLVKAVHTGVDEAREYLLHAAEVARRRQTCMTIRVDVRIGPPADGILAAAVEHAADVTVMATHGRTGVERAVLGSVAGQVVHAGHTPVLLVRPARLAGAAQPAFVQEPRPSFVVT